MNLKMKTFAAVALVIWGLLGAGCITGGGNKSPQPWARQADWENQMPGVPNSGMR